VGICIYVRYKGRNEISYQNNNYNNGLDTTRNEGGGRKEREKRPRWYDSLRNAWGMVGQEKKMLCGRERERKKARKKRAREANRFLAREARRSKNEIRKSECKKVKYQPGERSSQINIFFYPSRTNRMNG